MSYPTAHQIDDTVHVSLERPSREEISDCARDCPCTRHPTHIEWTPTIFMDLTAMREAHREGERHRRVLCDMPGCNRHAPHTAMTTSVRIFGGTSTYSANLCQLHANALAKPEPDTQRDLLRLMWLRGHEQAELQHHEARADEEEERADAAEARLAQAEAAAARTPPAYEAGGGDDE